MGRLKGLVRVECQPERSANARISSATTSIDLLKAPLLPLLKRQSYSITDLFIYLYFVMYSRLRASVWNLINGMRFRQ